MRKTLSIFIVIFVICTLLASFTSIAADNGEYVYTLDNGEAVITGVLSKVSFSGEKSIPETLGGYNVTKIAYEAFRDCTKLTAITVPQTVNSIGIRAFYGCSLLSDITLPDSVLSIAQNVFIGTAYAGDSGNWEDGALYINNHLISISSDKSNAFTVKDRTVSIASDACWSCSSITSVNLPESLENIGEGTFLGCTLLENVNVNDKNKKYSSVDGVLFDKYKTELVMYPAAKKAASYTVPVGTTKISPYAFASNNSISTVTLPDTVRTIGDGAFLDCTELSVATIPDTVKKIGDDAFYNTGIYNTASSWTDGVLYIGNHIVSANDDIANLYIAKDGTKTVADYAFYSCSQLTGIILPDTVTDIGSHAFEHCVNLNNIILPDSLTKIGPNAFYNTYQYNNQTNWTDNVLYINKQLIAAKQTKTGAYTVLTGTKTIADYAFYDCVDITGVNLPDSLSAVGAYAFAGCTKLEGIEVSGSASVGEGAFLNCTDLDDITLSDSVTAVGADALYGTAYYKDSDNWESGVLYLGSSLISASSSLSGRVSVKSGTKTIADNAFSGCEITRLTIPDGTLNIGQKMVLGCDSLEKVYAPEALRAKESIIKEGSPTQVIFGDIQILYGDVDSNGSVTRADLLRLAKHFSGWVVEIDESASDVDNNGSVTRADLLRLAKHFSGWTVSLGE